jgi:RNA polymerase sigma factor (sigma-70 family)
LTGEVSRSGGFGLASGGEKKPRTRRDYRPTVEGLEALRLLSGATQAHPLAGIAAHHNLLVDPVQQPLPLGEYSLAPSVSSATWDAALDHAPVAELLGSVPGGAAPAISTSQKPRVAAPSDDQALAAGLSQLNKYLNRAWYRAGISPQLHDDSSQAVYAALLQTMGRDQFDSLVADVGRSGIKDVFSRESSEGLSFFRAVDMVKKRAQRERVQPSLELIDVPASTSGETLRASRLAALQEAIDHNLSPREAALIQSTMMGKTPAEIALEWGVAAKTVSNEKTRVLQKLREALVNHELN